MLLHNWAQRWGVPPEAVADLLQMLNTDPAPQAGEDESAAQTAVRLEASRLGARLWRNNVGAGVLQNGSFVRWGLCNDSPQMNKRIKSADLVGIRPVVVTPSMVGGTFGQFVAREIKRPGWRYTGKEREAAQMAFLSMVLALGGDAAFATGEGTL